MIEAVARPRLLIVDDDRALGSMLGWAFEDLGYAISVAEDCDSALTRAKSGRWDFALIDYGLPDGDGHALARLLTRLQPELRIVMMSSDRAAAVAACNSDPTVSRILQKPLAPDSLDRWFRQSRPTSAVQP